LVNALCLLQVWCWRSNECIAVMETIPARLLLLLLLLLVEMT